MSNSAIPFNISLLQLTDDKLVGLKPVRVLDRFDGATKNFHEDGLFSVSIFGKVGDERRNRRFSYINIKVSILHPIVYRALIQLKRMYGDIIAGKVYAVWNKELKDFERSTPLEGRTGFQFFIENWKNVVFEERPSVQREQNIALIKKYKDKCLLNKLVVMPAGMRDIEIKDDGRVADDEINEFYRKILSLSNSISTSAIETNPEVLDSITLAIQTTYNSIYDHLENMLQGKKKLVMDKWAARKIFNGTRNVITSTNVKMEELHGKGNPGYNDSIVGLYQFLKASLPISRFNIKNGFLSKVFTGPNTPVVLVNKKTLKKEMVNLKSYYYDLWMTDEGLEKVITSFEGEIIRHKTLELEGYYMGLIYKGPDKTYRLMQDIEELPPTRLKEHVFPLTFCELLFLSVYKTANNYPGFFTRYPIAGFGSIYPTMIFLKPTVIGEVRRELDENWEPTDEANTAYHFPMPGEAFFNSMSPHGSHLKALTADFDGDTSSLTVVYSDESLKEVKKYLGSRSYYVGTNGKMAFSVNFETVERVVFGMTG